MAVRRQGPTTHLERLGVITGVNVLLAPTPALRGAALTLWWADAGWQTAIATWMLVIITALAVYFGWRAALAANETYALEAEPVIFVRQATSREEQGLMNWSVDWSHMVVAAERATPQGITIRRYNFGTDGQNLESLNTLGEVPKRPVLTLAFQNVGRSPAVGIKIGWDLSTSVFVKSADHPDRIGEQRSSGYISLPAIAAQDAAYVRVENLLGVAVKLSVKQTGTQIDWRSVQRHEKKIAVIGAAPNFTLKSL